MNLEIPKWRSNSTRQLLLFFLILTTLFCDRKQAQQDLQNAVSLGKNLSNHPTLSSEGSSPDALQQPAETVYDAQKHTLKPGETWQDLVAQYGTDGQSIQQANGIKDWNELKPGQTILIPINKCRPPDQ